MKQSVSETLLSLKDEKYKAFSVKLTPGIDENIVLGVRAPFLKTLAKELLKSGEYKEFISDLPHKYHEENNLHAYIIGGIRDSEEALSELQRFLPFVNNWATCDSLRPRIGKDLLLSCIYEWLKSEEIYTLRFAVEMLMVNFLGESFLTEYADRVARIKSDEYYVNMMIAWYFATALSKNTKDILPFFEGKVLPMWVHNKAIQKSIESYRISDELKTYLRTLRFR